MSEGRALALKIDVCTREGLDQGVPALLGLLKRHGLRASFFLAFGPDNSGRAIRHMLKPAFVAKMFRTRATSAYGLRTLLSGTLLPARPIATGRSDLVRRMAGEGHEVAIHGWDHRLWQDALPRMGRDRIRQELDSAADACAQILGERPRGTGAPAWLVTEESLAAQDAVGFAYASDLRGGPPCRVRLGGTTFTTPQLPSTGPCIEEILARGVRDIDAQCDEIVAGVARAKLAVLPVHAEMEGRAHTALLERVLPRLRDDRDLTTTVGGLFDLLNGRELPVRDVVLRRIAGRSGVVATAEAD